MTKIQGCINSPAHVNLPNGAGAVHCRAIPVMIRAIVRGSRLPNLYRHNIAIAYGMRSSAAPIDTVMNLSELRISSS